MNNYIVKFLRRGELFETIVCASSDVVARNYIANKYIIKPSFEFKTGFENANVDYVSSVIEV